MTKIAKILNLVFGRYVVGKTRLKETTISNEGTERITIATISSSSSSFKAELAETLEAKFPINSTLYYGDANGKYVDANGSYYTTNQGFGIIGTTNAVGLLTPTTDPCIISISSPATSAKIKLNTPTNVIWTSANVGLVDVIIESDYGYKIYENIDSSSGGGTQAIELLVADGFAINEDIIITVKAVVGSGQNSVVCQSISTISIGAPLAGALIPLNEDFTITYTSDGSVDICALSSIGDLEVLYSNEPAGTHSKTACQLSETLYDNGETITIRIRDHAVNTTKAEVAVVGKISVTLADITKEELDTNVEMSGTSNALAVKLEGQLADNSWVELVASLATSGGLYIKSDVKLRDADGFTANRSTPIRASSVTNNPATATKNIYTLATVTLSNIDSITATVAKSISGTTNGASVNIYYKLHSAGSWTLAGAGTVDEEAGTWTYSITIPTADTYDIKVTDGTDTDAYDQQDSIVVASASYKVQITTSDCALEVRDSVPVPGTTKIAMHGVATGTNANSTVAGVAIGNNTEVYVCLLYDVSTKSVDWVKSYASATAGQKCKPPRSHGNTILADSSYIYGFFNHTGIAGNLWAAKINISGSSVSIGAISSASMLDDYILSVCFNGSTLINMMCSNSGNPSYFRITKSTMAVASNIAVSAFHPYYAFMLASDANYQYSFGYNSSTKKATMYRVDSSNIRSTLKEFTASAPSDSAVALGMGLLGSTFIYSLAEGIEANYTYPTYKRVSDGINTNIIMMGQILLPNSKIIVRKINSSPFANEMNKTLACLNADLSTKWDKDYTADTVSQVASCVYCDGKYFIVGSTAGNFDGSHAGNTTKQPIVAEIDIDSGDI